MVSQKTHGKKHFYHISKNVYYDKYQVTQHGAPLKKKQIKGGGTSANSRFQDETSSDGDEDDELH